jgi:hypothetical protein
MIRLMKQGLRDITDPDSDSERVLFGFFGIVVFGRAVTSALQNLRSFDRTAFDAWYDPWETEMRQDELLLYFYKLRTRLLKDIDPMIGIVLSSFGEKAPPAGAITTAGMPLPTRHQGTAITDASMVHLCGLYVEYLQRMVDAAAPVIWEVQDRLYPPQSG